jgi:predicted DNA-binding transcriptional regulator AlpA
MARQVDPFPAPLRLGDGASAIVAWRQSDVSAWLDRRIAPNPESHGETI